MAEGARYIRTDRDAAGAGDSGNRREILTLQVANDQCRADRDGIEVDFIDPARQHGRDVEERVDDYRRLADRGRFAYGDGIICAVKHHRPDIVRYRCARQRQSGSVVSGQDDAPGLAGNRGTAQQYVGSLGIRSLVDAVGALCRGPCRRNREGCREHGTIVSRDHESLSLGRHGERCHGIIDLLSEPIRDRRQGQTRDNRDGAVSFRDQQHVGGHRERRVRSVHDNDRRAVRDRVEVRRVGIIGCDGGRERCSDVNERLALRRGMCIRSVRVLIQDYGPLL